MGRKGLSMSTLMWLERVYKSCKTDEQRQVYFEWEERLFRIHTLPAAKQDTLFK